MAHQSTLSSILSIFIIVLFSCNIFTSMAARLLPPKPESPTLPNSEAPPPHHEWRFPKFRWPRTNFPKHEQSKTQPKTATLSPWLQGPPTKAEEPTPPEHHSPPQLEEPKFQPIPEHLGPQPNVPSFHEWQSIPKPKWAMPKLLPHPRVTKWPISEATPKAERPTPMKHEVPALPPLNEIPSLISPEMAPIHSVVLAPSSAEP